MSQRGIRIYVSCLTDKGAFVLGHKEERMEKDAGISHLELGPMFLHVQGCETKIHLNVAVCDSYHLLSQKNVNGFLNTDLQ